MQSIGRESMLELIEGLSHGAAAGADAEVRLQLLERRGGDDPRQDRGRDEVAAAPRARVAPEADRRAPDSREPVRPRGAVALEVGIVGLPGAGKTTLFTALTTTGGARLRQDERRHGADRRRAARQARAASSRARKITPAAIRVVGRPRHRAALLGDLRQVDALLVVLDGYSAGAAPADDLETLELELLVADRDHVERRLERVEKQAKSGDASAAQGGRRARTRSSRTSTRANTLADWPGRAAARAGAADDEAAARGRERPGGIDLKLEAELAELSDEEAAEFRDGGPSALDEVVRRLRDALGLITFFTAGEKETRAWTLRHGQTALEAAETIHSDIARGFIRCEVIRLGRSRAGRLACRGARRGTAAARGQDLRGPGRRRPEHPLQHLTRSSRQEPRAAPRRSSVHAADVVPPDESVRFGHPLSVTRGLTRQRSSLRRRGRPRRRTAASLRLAR